MCLLFQRQDENVEVTWDGRAGQYINEELRIAVAKFPQREPSSDERTGRRNPRYGSLGEKEYRGIVK